MAWQTGSNLGQASFRDVLLGKAKRNPVIQPQPHQMSGHSNSEVTVSIEDRYTNPPCDFSGSEAGPTERTKQFPVKNVPGLINSKEAFLQSLLSDVEKPKRNKKKPTKNPLNLVDFIAPVSTPVKTKTTHHQQAPHANQKSSTAQTAIKGQQQQLTTKPKVLPKGTSGGHGNVLDSSVPVFHKGKNREGKKHLTTARKIINREKEENKELGNTFPPEDKPHNRRFRGYCENLVTPELDESVNSLLQRLHQFQDRVYHKDPSKFKIKRRLVCGLREVRKFIDVDKICCVVIAPNVDRVMASGGLDDQLGRIISMCKDKNITYLFAMNKFKLGKCLFKPSPVSCVGILNSQGAEDFYKAMLCALEAAKEGYHEKLVRITANAAADNCLSEPSAAENKILAGDNGVSTLSRLSIDAKEFVPQQQLGVVAPGEEFIDTPSPDLEPVVESAKYNSPNTIYDMELNDRESAKYNSPTTINDTELNEQELSDRLTAVSLSADAQEFVPSWTQAGSMPAFEFLQPESAAQPYLDQPPYPPIFDSFGNLITRNAHFNLQGLDGYALPPPAAYYNWSWQ